MLWFRNITRTLACFWVWSKRLGDMKKRENKEAEKELEKLENDVVHLNF